MKLRYRIDKRIFSLFILILSLSIHSCEEVVEINLNSSTPIIVAEGVIEEDSVCIVKLSYTNDYFNNQEPEYIENARVLLIENGSNSELLNYLGKGVYKGTNIRGKNNRLYSIDVSGQNFEFTAESYLVPSPSILSIKFEKSDFQRPGEMNEEYTATLLFSDDPNTVNYYMVKFFKNKTEANNGYSLLKDAYYIDNKTIEYSSMRYRFEQGDSITARVYSIDRETYSYYSQLNDLMEQGMGGSSTPYNPKSYNGVNIMGHFGAFSYDKISAVVN